MLSLAADQDEEDVLRMVNTVCEVLKDPPLGGHHREMSVAAGKEDEEVYFPGAAATVVSCREDPGCLNAGYVCAYGFTRQYKSWPGLSSTLSDYCQSTACASD